MSQLRRVLEAHGAPYKVLVRKPAGYVLQVPASDIGAARFASPIERAKTAGPAEANTIESGTGQLG